MPADAFGGYYDSGAQVWVRSYSLGTAPNDRPVRWALTSAGPDGQDNAVPLF